VFNHIKSIIILFWPEVGYLVQVRLFTSDNITSSQEANRSLYSPNKSFVTNNQGKFNNKNSSASVRTIKSTQSIISELKIKFDFDFVFEKDEYLHFKTKVTQELDNI